MNVALGTYYAWSVFVPALEHEFGWNRTQTSLVPTIASVMIASMFLVAGFLQRRIGPRSVAVIGGVLFSSGLLLASWTHSLSMLYLTWGVMLGAGVGFGYLVPITVGSKWFPHHRGLVNGLAIGIFAAGSGLFGPLAGLLVERIGWRATFQVIAGNLFRVYDGRRLPAEGSTARIHGPGKKSIGVIRPSAHPVDVPTWQVLLEPGLSGALGRLCAWHHRRNHGHQPAGAFRTVGGLEREDRRVCPYRGRHRQRFWTVFFGLVFRPPRPPAYFARHHL